jgi:hypothetical protein
LALDDRAEFRYAAFLDVSSQMPPRYAGGADISQFRFPPAFSGRHRPHFSFLNSFAELASSSRCAWAPQFPRPDEACLMHADYDRIARFR